MQLTNKEETVFIAIYKNALDNMGGKIAADLAYDNFSWFNCKDIVELTGMSKHEASGVMSSLDEKGLIAAFDPPEWGITDKGIQQGIEMEITVQVKQPNKGADTMLTQIEKVRKGKWNVINAGGEILFTAKTKTECERFSPPVEEEPAGTFTMKVKESLEETAIPAMLNKKEKRSWVLAHLERRIAEGIFTRKELLKAATSVFPEVSESSINTYLSDCKNPKYNPFERLVITAPNGVYLFQKD